MDGIQIEGTPEERGAAYAKVLLEKMTHREAEVHARDMRKSAEDAEEKMFWIWVSHALFV